MANISARSPATPYSAPSGDVDSTSNSHSVPPRSINQCQAVWPASTESMMAPVRLVLSPGMYLKSILRIGTQIRITSNWPSSTPTLKARSEAARCSPPKGSISRRA